MYDDTPVILPIITALGTILALMAVLIGYGPVLDYFSIYIASLPENPYTVYWVMAVKFVYVLIGAVALVAIVRVWKVVLQKIRYRRDVY